MFGSTRKTIATFSMTLPRHPSLRQAKQRPATPHAQGIKRMSPSTLTEKTLPSNKVFLTNVQYNYKMIKFVPISAFATKGGEHYQTSDLFIEAAKTDSLKEWERRGIPPIFAAFDPEKSRWYHVIGEGQTRLNSANRAQEITGKEVRVPVWDISSFSTIDHDPTHRNSFNSTLPWIQYRGHLDHKWNLNKLGMERVNRPSSDGEDWIG